MMSTKQKRPSEPTPETLEAWRVARGFDQRTAAAYLGISQSYYCKLENHRQSPRRAMLKRITERTGVPVAELMGIAA